mgnify:CR=1 FL=1
MIVRYISKGVNVGRSARVGISAVVSCASFSVKSSRRRWIVVISSPVCLVGASLEGDVIVIS